MIITYASADNESLGGLLFGLALIVTLLIVAYNGGFTHETGELTPINHEVTLRPGGVIDAVKYDIIEQRGAIYVIEEREAIAE
ncbi:hypothetical protein [Paenibacillus odorifer]|uniref:hypothetical protein n=2 Tax=Paenibacillus TaxID=44249 RepID=UPI00117FCA47|nr:hypothetical protein [Paenibacillus odorifer]